MRPSAPVTPGLVVVDKPAGITSHDVVARVRRLAGTRKVGHAGTLDPMATEKAYAATVRLGVSTGTDDAEGEVSATPGAAGVDEQQVRDALTGFVGDIEQVPTAVSAIKVDGKRAYQRVRDGEQVELAARPVTIHELVVHDVRRSTVEGLEVLDADITMRCSSGTYVRAIARDAGALLGTGGHLTALRRTAVGPYDLAVARTLDDLDAQQARDVRVGRPLDLPLDTLTGVFDPDGEFLALYEPREGRARPVAVFVQG